LETAQGLENAGRDQSGQCGKLAGCPSKSGDQVGSGAVLGNSKARKGENGERLDHGDGLTIRSMVLCKIDTEEERVKVKRCLSSG